MTARRPQLNRPAALSAVPVRLPILRLRERRGGGALITVACALPRWTRWLGARNSAERTFGLDVVGRQVYAACDGKTDVAGIVRAFAKARRISQPEAEMAVTNFLKTLIFKGLVAVAVEEEETK